MTTFRFSDGMTVSAIVPFWGIIVAVSAAIFLLVNDSHVYNPRTVKQARGAIVLAAVGHIAFVLGVLIGVHIA